MILIEDWCRGTEKDEEIESKIQCYQLLLSNNEKTKMTG